MEHLELAYELLVIMIGLATLSISLSWTLRTGEADLRNFMVLYALFTLALILALVTKYLALNVADYSPRTWYWLSGLRQVVDFAVIVAVIHFLANAYRIRARRWITLAFVALLVIAEGLVISPIGAVLDAETRVIRLGPGVEIASGLYLAAFTFAIVLGWGWLHRVWKTDRRLFVIGLMIFATVGYLESIFGFSRLLHSPSASQAARGTFLISSIPYALYGIFVTVYFLRYFVPATVEVDQLFEAFLDKYGITGRERQIILMVAQGKSNVDIARELVVSLATVKTHLHNIYGKIGVKSRYDLLARVRSGQ
ncbi:MAG TPA: LuxR C-terminal-related transcriptional regulator [Anaerolineales bacterium]